MGENVEEILIEVDRMMALAGERGMTSITQRRASSFRQIEFNGQTKAASTPTI
jgi:hypothetical protein